MTNNQDIGAMLRKLAKTPGIVFNPKTGEIVADHTATTTGKSKTYSPQESQKLLSHLQGICHAKEDLVAVPAKPAKKAPTFAEECKIKEAMNPEEANFMNHVVDEMIRKNQVAIDELTEECRQAYLARQAVPVARTLPTRPKKVVCPKKDEFSEWYCDIHDDEPLLHDGEGGFYCYTCENVVLCVNCESVMEREDIYYTQDSGTLQEEHYCEECYDDVRPDVDSYYK